MSKESQIEDSLIQQLIELKYFYRSDVVDRKTLELNFKTKFEALNRVKLTGKAYLTKALKRHNIPRIGVAHSKNSPYTHTALQGRNNLPNMMNAACGINYYTLSGFLDRPSILVTQCESLREYKNG